MIDARLATDPNKNGTSEQAKKAEADARRAAINACKDADGKFFKWRESFVQMVPVHEALHLPEAWLERRQAPL